MLPCDICGKTGHSWFSCPDRGKKPDGWKPPRLAKHMAPPTVDIITPTGTTKHVVVSSARKSGKTAAVAEIAVDLRAKGVDVVDLNAKPAAKRGKGRPKSIEDMKAYKAQKQREYRAKKDKQP